MPNAAAQLGLRYGKTIHGSSAPHSLIGTTDIYGGYTELPVPGGATGKFRTGMLGNRWVLVTPLGNAFWMRGVYNVTVDTHVDDLGSTYTARVTAKYGNADTLWGPQINRRLQAKGFNALAEYASNWTLPWTTHASWPGDQSQPVKLPAVPFPIQASSYASRNLFGYISEGVKQLYKPFTAGDAYHDAGGYIGNFADVYDPKFETWVNARVSASFVSIASSPYLIGISTDDGDYTTGFGGGPDFVPVASNYHPHLGYVVACTAPTQTSAVIEGVTQNYSDTEVYSKSAWRDFLIARYTTIAALNTAWSTSSFYTTWDSTGTWGTGTGLLDEDGRHSWMGTSFSHLTGANATAKQDMDDFLYEIAAKYFTVYRAAIDTYVPGTLLLGPTTVGAWGAPARRQVCQAAGESIDLMRLSWTGETDRIDFIEQYAGDLPLAAWIGAVANPDSAFFRYSGNNAGYHFSTEAERANFYLTDRLNVMLTMTATATGNYPFVGLQWWEFHDNWGEKLNWGLVSLSDNFYDGVEAVVAGGTDAWGYPTGGEEDDYGDSVGGMQSAHANIVQVIGA